jgi:Flp pilus assembly protein TadD
MAGAAIETDLQAVQGLLMRGAAAEALDKVQALAAAAPDDARLANMEGIALNLLRQPREAEAAFRRAVALDPTHVGAHVNLANLHVITARFREAEPICRAGLALNPESDNRAKLTYLLATSLAATGQPEEAVTWYRAALEVNRDQLQAQLGLAKALGNLRRFVEAWEVAARAGERWPDDPELAWLRARLLIDQNRTVDALALLDGWKDRLDSYPKLHQIFAVALRERQRGEEAATHFRRAVELDPVDYLSWTELALLESSLGHKEAALEAAQRALKLKHDHVPAMGALLDLEKASPGSPSYDAVHAAFEDPEAEERPKVTLGMALYRSHDRLGEYDTAWDFLARSKAIKARVQPYDMAAVLRVIDALKAQFRSSPVLDAVTVARMSARFRPVFIVGMPRSGTSLVEQILASHSAVFGGGEMPAMGAAVARQGWNERNTGAAPTPDVLAAIRFDYLGYVEDFAPGAAVVTDKTPLNFRWLGFILAALPEAKVLFMKRDARATCFANFSQDFTGETNNFGNDLGDTVTMYKAHLALKEFWEAAYPGRIVTVDYERLTEHQEEESRRLVAAAGLDWEDACLDFHRTKRAVNTASSQQVRQKMYTGSSQKWRRYEAHLGPMLEGLAGFD